MQECAYLRKIRKEGESFIFLLKNASGAVSEGRPVFAACSIPTAGGRVGLLGNSPTDIQSDALAPRFD
jgi:hypothetical protein